MSAPYGTPVEFKAKLLESLANHRIKCALMCSEDIGDSLDAGYFNSSGEISGEGYDSGGQELSGFRVMTDGNCAFATWANPTWGPNASIPEVDTAVIHDADQGGLILGVYKFDYCSVRNGTFMLELPEATATEALVRIR